jgi:hypothetical protein
MFGSIFALLNERNGRQEKSVKRPGTFGAPVRPVVSEGCHVTSPMRQADQANARP